MSEEQISFVLFKGNYYIHTHFWPQTVLLLVLIENFLSRLKFMP